jgi:hypothetical protein
MYEIDVVEIELIKARSIISSPPRVADTENELILIFEIVACDGSRIRQHLPQI